MKATAIFATILAHISGISKPFSKFLNHLVITLLSYKGKNNFLNLSRWSNLHEKTFRRNYKKSCDFLKINTCLIDKFHPNEVFVAAIDCSYISKSGTKTYGLGKFWSGCAQKALKGLEISVISLVNIKNKQCFSISTEQVPSIKTEENRLDFYLTQLERCSDFLTSKAKFLVADGFYAKNKFWTKTEELGLSLITKLRNDANMTYIYEGEQKKMGDEE